MTHRPRPATIRDRDAICGIARSSGLFDAGEESLVMDAFDSDMAANEPRGSMWIVTDDAQPLAAAYCVPEPAGDRVWNLLFIAAAPEARRLGRGRALIDAIVYDVRSRGGRMLLVETSDADEQAGARDLYRRCGFSNVATVPDYYADGVSKVVFSRRVD